MGHMIAFVLFSELFWHPSCTDFTKAKLVMDNIICRTKLICWWYATSSIITLRLVWIMTLICSIVSCGRGSASWPFLVLSLVDCFWIFRFIHIHFPVVKHYPHNLKVFCCFCNAAPDNLQTTKTESLHAVLCWCKRREGQTSLSCINPQLTDATDDLTAVSYTHLDVYKRQL